MTENGLPADRLSRILTAVETIEASLGVLARKQRLSRSEYENDSDTQDIVERRFVKMTEAAIDIAEELVKHEREQPPRSNPESMRMLGELDVLSASLAEEMAQGARFRNVLAHTYGNIIDHDVVYNALQDLERYRDFVKAVRVYLDSIGALDD
ncbi:type VII toxin-antitoxin system HepT family RNase toxin [Halorientalis pallida]|uniref:type VII toxin-antitoxin system HepT family RNase toxin n=1 Tax=Halorientalis pallida TaxID=2479928 RepID=UPI003C6F66CB